MNCEPAVPPFPSSAQPGIEIPAPCLHDLNCASQIEWLETNGLGGSASSSVIGLNTRRYHGLLVAATDPPGGRIVLLSKLEESLILIDATGNKHSYDLSVNHYPGCLHPLGHLHLLKFRLDPYPIFTYAFEQVRLEKHVFMPHSENTVCISYEISGLAAGTSAQLSIRPLLAFADFHSTPHENGEWNRAFTQASNGLVLRPYQRHPALHIFHTIGTIQTTGHWYLNFELVAERDRGLDWHEDLFQPFELGCSVAPATPTRLIASIEPHDIAEFEALLAKELARRAVLPKIIAAAPAVMTQTGNAADVQHCLAQQLANVADQFIVRRGAGSTIIAGYPWFGDWGRDTMIALTGLTLVTGRFDIARDLLCNFARYLDMGMLPNRFPDSGQEPEYNTVDATLWMFEAVRTLLHYTGDFRFICDNLYQPLCDVIDWHVRGTRYNIHMDKDGLLAAGTPGVQLTWMDAKVGDWVVTPRIGKPVEIQALWFNALCVLHDLAMLCGDAPRANACGALAGLAQSSFNAKFWNESEHCLFDVVDVPDSDAPDAAIRPNQIFAASLPHTMLSDQRMRLVLERVERELLTPVGLRSLSPRDSRYMPHYAGGVVSRDGAYHQGTVWAWLMGPFVTAYARVYGRTAARERNLLKGFIPHLNQAGLGTISEVFDAAAPHTPGGCIAQAWSVAELLRCIAQDL